MNHTVKIEVDTLAIGWIIIKFHCPVIIVTILFIYKPLRSAFTGRCLTVQLINYAWVRERVMLLRSSSEDYEFLINNMINFYSPNSLWRKNFIVQRSVMLVRRGGTLYISIIFNISLLTQFMSVKNPKNLQLIHVLPPSTSCLKFMSSNSLYKLFLQLSDMIGINNWAKQKTIIKCQPWHEERKIDVRLVETMVRTKLTCTHTN